MDLKNQTILITGGSSGIGLELAKRLAARQNKVLICGRSQEKLDQARKEEPSLEIFQCDLSNQEDCMRLVEWVKTNHPQLSMLINNAALVHTDDLLHGKNMLSKAQLEFDTNVIAPILLAAELMPLLWQRNSTIVNVTSGLAYVPRAAYPFYNSTKAALHSFTQVLRFQSQKSSVKIIEAMFPAVDTPWHNGKAPKIAIPVGKAVEEMIDGIDKDKEEIRIGKVKLVYWLSRIAPAFAFRKINSLK